MIFDKKLSSFGNVGKVQVYYNSAQHSEDVKSTLGTLRQKYPTETIWVIFEPCSYLKTKAVFNKYNGIFESANNVLIAPINKIRKKEEVEIFKKLIVKISSHKNIKSFESITGVIINILKGINENDVIIVINADKEHLLAKEILRSINYYKNNKENPDLLVGENLSFYTTVKIGGPACFFTKIYSEESLIRIIKEAKHFGVSYKVIGGGSNILVSDNGTRGLILKCKHKGLKIDGKKVLVKAGELLQDLIDKVIDARLSGVEALSWIPGSVGGAIYGNAGAYGQTISDHLVRVKIFDGDNIIWLTKKECAFSYRSSIFKKKDCVILEAEFEFESGNENEIRKKANEIIKIRKEKFPIDMRCPGSFFKNIIADSLPYKVLSKIPKEKIVNGKIPAGYLLEMVGAKGKNLGGVEISKNHGNMIVNVRHGTAKDFITLSSLYGNKVKNKFGIILSPEVEFIGDF